jgi:hypothetical protein
MRFYKCEKEERKQLNSKTSLTDFTQQLSPDRISVTILSGLTRLFQKVLWGKDKCRFTAPSGSMAKEVDLAKKRFSADL